MQCVSYPLLSEVGLEAEQYLTHKQKFVVSINTRKAAERRYWYRLHHKQIKPTSMNKPSQKDCIGQCLGIDVSKDSLSCCYVYQTSKKEIKVKGMRTFSNDNKGYEEVCKWLKKWQVSELELPVVMEATGVYYENLAYYLSGEKGLKVSVVLPNMVKYFANSLNTKSKNDKIDSKIIAQLGVERQLEAWQAPSETARTLKELTREREMLLEDKTSTGNQLHAMEHAKGTNKATISRTKKRIKMLDNQIKSIEKEIHALIKENQEVTQAVERLCAVPGVGVITAVTVLSETDFFRLFRNKSQVVSYAGLDVIEKQSGSSISGKPRISKKGNSRLRKILYMAALSHIRKGSIYYSNYKNILAKNKAKKIGIVAVQRKLLVLMYALHKKQEDFNPSYFQKKAGEEKEGGTA